MGIVNPYMVKNDLGKTAGQSVELEADPGQSFLVKDVLVARNNATMTDITVDKAMVGRFRTAKTLGSHLSFSYGMSAAFDATAILRLKPQHTILDYLGSLDVFNGFPIAEGQKMVITPAVAAEHLGDVQIVYEEYEGGDITSEMENGSESTEYMIINYGDVGQSIPATGTFHVNSQNSPTEFPQFPYGKVVPAKTEIELLGILASDVLDYLTSANYLRTTFLKLVKERTVLFDDDRQGLLFKGDIGDTADATTFYGCGESMIGNYSTEDLRKPFMLKEPLIFGAGEELNIYLSTDEHGAGAGLVQSDTEIGLIMKIRRVS